MLISDNKRTYGIIKTSKKGEDILRFYYKALGTFRFDEKREDETLIIRIYDSYHSYGNLKVFFDNLFMGEKIYLDDEEEIK